MSMRQLSNGSDLGGEGEEQGEKSSPRRSRYRPTSSDKITRRLPFQRREAADAEHLHVARAAVGQLNPAGRGAVRSVGRGGGRGEVH